MEGAFEEAPYGYKRNLADGAVEIIINPGKSTGEGRKDLDEDGLRPHPGEISEHVTVVGPGNGREVIYRFRGPDGNVEERCYGAGESFYSVETGTVGVLGYSHVLINPSEKRAVLLRIRAEKQ